MKFIVFEDARVSGLSPITDTRAAFDLRCGTMTLLERVRHVFPDGEVRAQVRPSLEEVVRHDHLDIPVNEEFRADDGMVALINARWFCPWETRLPDGPAIGLVDREPAFVVCSASDAQRLLDEGDDYPSEPGSSFERVEAGGFVFRYPWEVVSFNQWAVELDARWRESVNGIKYRREGVLVIGSPERLFLHPDVECEPDVVFDTRSGPIIVDEGVRIESFSRLTGPCHVSRGCRILGARVTGGSIGPECRVGGEFEESILQGYVNKYHDGFLGHSYLGEWVNVGAGTQFSDLRNDYASVRMITGEGKVDSDEMKVGAFLGDHTRISVNNSFNTGTIIGPFCTLASPGGFLPRYLSPFSQVVNGESSERSELHKIFETCSVAMSRRGQCWSEVMERYALSLYESSSDERWQVLHSEAYRSGGFPAIR